MQLEEVLDELAYMEGVFPYGAVEEAVRLREEITPELLRVLTLVTEDPESFAAEEDLGIHIFAIYLLAKFREGRALPLLLRMLSLPEETLDEIWGDVLLQDLPRIFLSISDGADAHLKALIEDEAATQTVRSAALDALVEQVAVGQRSREEVMAYFAHLFHTRDRSKETFFWSDLACSAAYLWPGEVEQEIRALFEKDLIDPESIHPEDIDEALALGKEGALARLHGPRHGFIDDLEQQMSWMEGFHAPPDDQPDPIGSPAPALNPDDLPYSPIVGFEPLGDDDDMLPDTYVRPEPKVGRNDPCICGSGKKYKKCCGG